ncbi:MAG TPA: type II toxin-antitoxin system Phd/YefM family antitoxin [Burkholderiaceae bacterium]|jgi:prevent-host-death family protein
MEDVWQVQEAKSRFSELIDRAIEQGPQIVTRHGKAVVRVVAVGSSERATPDDGFAAFLLSAPRVLDHGLELPKRRSRKHSPFDER